MPLEVQRGVAVLHGIRNDGTVIDIDYQAFIDTSKLQHKFKLDAIEDEQGFDAAWIATNEHFELDITLTPKNASRAAVEAATVTLDPLDSITIAHFSVAVFNGTWGYIGDQSVELSKGKEGKVTLKFRKYADTDQNTAFGTVIS